MPEIDPREMQGTVSPENLSSAFRELQARRASGVLYVDDGTSTKRIAFRDGRIVGAASSDSDRTLEEPQVHALFQSLGEYRFEETEPGDGLPDQLDLSPEDVASRALEGIDALLKAELRWSGSGGPPLSYAESTLSTTHTDLVDILRAKLRPGLTTSDLIEMSNLSRAETLAALKALIDAGIVAAHDGPETHEGTDRDASNRETSSLFPSGSTPEKLGRFDVQRILGRGSMGAVLLARDPAMDRTVAIKLVQTATHLPPAKQEKYRERFYREASAAGQLTHPNIVTVFDVGHADDDTPFIVMEYVQGRTLSEILDTETLSLAQAFQIAHDILEGLAFAHAQGIVHRDVKPGNIIVTPDFRAKIMDFGIAHVVGSELTTDDDLLGSPYYMAPEQLSKGTIDRRTDLFSFAVVLYRMLTGNLPFNGESFAAIAQSILNDEPTPPDEKNPAISPSVRSVVLRCLEKDARDRYDSAEEVAAALETARKSTSGNALTRRVRRTVQASQDRWLSISVALVLGAFLVFGLMLTIDRRSPPDDSVSVPSGNPSPPLEAAEPVAPDAAVEEPGEESDEIAPSGGAPSSVVSSPPPPRQEPRPAPAPRPRPTPTPAEPPEPAMPPEDEGPTMADLFFEAQMALERGELEESQAWLEELLLKDPRFEGAADLLTEVKDRIWEENLPLTFDARHNHSLGGCEGELSLTTLGVRYVSDAHDWAWSHDEIRVLERPDDETFVVETFETSMFGLGKNKRYKFELDGTLSGEDWGRYERLTR